MYFPFKIQINLDNYFSMIQKREFCRTPRRKENPLQFKNKIVTLLQIKQGIKQ